jgi:hypothetical protein
MQTKLLTQMRLIILLHIQDICRQYLIETTLCHPHAKQKIAHAENYNHIQYSVYNITKARLQEHLHIKAFQKTF